MWLISSFLEHAEAQVAKPVQGNLAIELNLVILIEDRSPFRGILLQFV